MTFAREELGVTVTGPVGPPAVPILAMPTLSVLAILRLLCTHTQTPQSLTECASGALELTAHPVPEGSDTGGPSGHTPGEVARDRLSHAPTFILNHGSD